MPRPVQLQNNRQRQREENEIHDDVEDLVDNEELVPVDALSLDILVPVPFQRPTLQGTNQEDGGAPETYQPHDGGRYPLECPGRKDSSVEAHNRQSERGAQKKVRKLVGKKYLGHGLARTRWWLVGVH